MYTSYFAKYKGNQGINIAMKSPNWFTGYSYPQLFPKRSFLFQYFNDKDENAYTKAYYDQVLLKLYPNQVYNDLQNKVLLCYEKSGSFCHRRLVADWIFNTIGIEVKEL